MVTYYAATVKPSRRTLDQPGISVNSTAAFGAPLLRIPLLLLVLVDIIAGSHSQVCTRLTVVVNKEDGSLREWSDSSAKNRDYRANTDNCCAKKKTTETSGS